MDNLAKEIFDLGCSMNRAKAEEIRNNEVKANARLIAAAPDMFQILKRINARLDIEAAEKGEDGIFPCSAWRNDIKAAISKAEGK